MNNEPRRERIDVARWLSLAGLASALGLYWKFEGERAQERERNAQIAKKLGATPGGFKLLENSFVGLAAAGILLGSVYYGEKMKNYGKKEWRAMPGHFKRLITMGI